MMQPNLDVWKLNWVHGQSNDVDVIRQAFKDWWKIVMDDPRTAERIQNLVDTEGSQIQLLCSIGGPYDSSIPHAND